MTITYGYDANGNTILKSDSSKPGEDVTFDYDVANHLVRTTQGAAILGKYDYNADGMRVRHYGSERGDVSYYYDDGAVLEEYVDGASGGLLAHYRYGDRLLSLDAPSDGGVQYYHHDALGSTVNLTDSAGAAKVSYTLDPWGHIRSQQGSSVNRQIFTGQEHDENTGLIYFGARYYDPDSARFISQDSYLGEPGTPPSLHRYLYVYSNPTVYVDPNGNAPVIGDIARFLEGLSKDNKDELARMNRGMQEKGAWGQLATRTTAAFMGIGGTILDASAGAANLIDLSADTQIAAAPLLRNTNVGKKSRERIEETVKTSVLSAKKVYEYVTTEDPAAMAQAAKEKLGNYLDKTFIEGDLSYTADFSGKAFGVALAGASVRATQLGKATGVTTAGEDAVTQTAIRRKVLANIEASQGARPSKDIEIFFARSNQIESGYKPDVWRLTTLEEGDVVYGGLPGQSAYYAPRSVLEVAEGSNVRFFQSLQAEKHPIKGYRPEVGEYVVKKRFDVPTGHALSNTIHGDGGAEQFFIRSFKKALELRQRIPFEE